MAERPGSEREEALRLLTELSVSLETQEPEYVVIGIGVNCNQKRFPEELSMATSLRMEQGSRWM